MRTGHLLALLTVAPLARATAQEPAPASTLASATLPEQLYVSNCARCHGMDGAGGLGPSLRQPTLRRGATDDAVVRLILNGIPGTAMAGFWNLSEDEAKSLTSYVRSLGRLPPEVVPGDSALGRALYAGAGACGTCHILRGEGAGWAPDLSDVGRRLNAAALWQSLLEPGANQPVSPLPSVHGPYPRYLAIVAVTTAGDTLRGTRVAEDDFTLLIRDADGRIVSLDKPTLRHITKSPGQSPMPSFAATFTGQQLDDLVAYLASLKGNP